MLEDHGAIDGNDRLTGGLDPVAGTRRFWIGVASRDHVNVGVTRAVIQLNHGKEAPLRRLKAGDGVIMYSPRTAYPDGEPLQAFTAIGTVATGEVYQDEVTPDFRPHRVDVQFVHSKKAQIKPLIGHLSFIKNRSHWGAAFRFGSVEIPGCDFALIAEEMGAAPLAEYARSMGGGVPSVQFACRQSRATR
jgi:hypothetical protein